MENGYIRSLITGCWKCCTTVINWAVYLCSLSTNTVSDTQFCGTDKLHGTIQHECHALSSVQMQNTLIKLCNSKHDVLILHLTHQMLWWSIRKTDRCLCWSWALDTVAELGLQCWILVYVRQSSYYVQIFDGFVNKG